MPRDSGLVADFSATDAGRICFLERKLRAARADMAAARAFILLLAGLLALATYIIYQLAIAEGTLG